MQNFGARHFQKNSGPLKNVCVCGPKLGRLARMPLAHPHFTGLDGLKLEAVFSLNVPA